MNENAKHSYCLTQLEVYNWGPFKNLHQMIFDPSGCALIGQTGSGKTTLVDALMTLICPQPKYNLASTGGHESDRDLMSYIRGVTGEGGDDASIHIARAEQTVTGISAEFSLLNTNHKIISVRLTALLWLDSSSTSQSDMKRLWIFDQDNHQSLSDYLQQLQDLSIRGLKLQLKDQANLIASNNKKTYLAHCRRFFEVGENAFVLLNRAAGLKQLNSIDDLFRELVLDDRSAFKRAQEVCNEFEELNAIHSELTLAREQQQSLIPIKETWVKQQKQVKQINALNEQQRLLPQWYAHHAKTLWQQQADKKQAEIKQQNDQLLQQTRNAKRQQGFVDEYYQQYQKLGGSSIEELKRQIDENQQHGLQIQQNARDYQQLCKALQLSPTLSADSLLNNQQLAVSKLSALNTRLNELEKQREQQTQVTLNTEDTCAELEKEISKVKATPDSNIPTDFLHFQKILADYLHVSIDEIPFIGQCIEVKDKVWQGAIERAIGSHRLRLVIDEKHMQTCLNWINQRNNHLHIRLLNTTDYQKNTQSMSDGFSEKLNFKTINQQNVIENFINSIDRHCVSCADDLRHTPFGLTSQGLMSGKRGLFEKHDHRPLNRGWMTGFDNRNRLAELTQQLKENQTSAQAHRQHLEQTKSQLQQFIQHQNLLQSLQKLSFQELDLNSIEAHIQQLNNQLDALQNPQSDTAKAQQLWQQATSELDQIQQKINQLNVTLELSKNAKLHAEKQRLDAASRQTEPMTDEQLNMMATSYNTPDENQLEQLNALEREDTLKLQQKITSHLKQLASLETRLGKLMISAKQKDTGALNEAATELEDISTYLDRLDLLTKEALPEKVQRFLDYLNTSSDQGVTQLLTRIENEVTVIEERIEELNATLHEVDFQPGRYLKLQPQKVNHEALQSLHTAQRNLRSAALQDDQGESHFKALMIMVQQLSQAVERKRNRPALALLDPRYRLQFSVSVIERETQKVIETRTGSKGGSGGEKEIIASFILTASLSYALCPQGSKHPLFGTVILDEAFSKSSQAVATRIISALKQFGLHPLFVTPNKEMRLLRNHTQSAVLVHRRGVESKALSLSWKEIDQHILQRSKN